MNKVSVLLLFLFFGELNCKKEDKTLECNCIIVPPSSDRYEYPVKAGSSDWNAAGVAGGLDSIYKLCQVPQSKIVNMSTMGVIQTLEDNPALFNMFLRDNKFYGRNEVLSRLNISWELNKRTDAGVVILQYYSKKNPCCVETISDTNDKGAFANKWYLFDMICTQDSIINQLDSQSKKSFARVVVDRYAVQLTYPNTFGSSKTSSVLVLSQLMIKANYQPYVSALQADAGLNSFALTGLMSANDVLNTVLRYANSFITD